VVLSFITESCCQPSQYHVNKIAYNSITIFLNYIFLENVLLDDLKFSYPKSMLGYVEISSHFDDEDLSKIIA
jgi:hypothetical protein